MAALSFEPAYEMSVWQKTARRLTYGLGMFLAMYESFWGVDRTFLHGLRHRELPTAKLPGPIFLVAAMLTLAVLLCQLYYFLRHREAKLWKPRWKAAGIKAERHEFLMTSFYGLTAVLLLADIWVALHVTWPT